MIRALLSLLFGRNRKAQSLPHFERLLIGNTITTRKGK